MLAQRLHEEWRARERAVPISPTLRFGPAGLTLGAGTVLVAADAPRELADLEGQEPRLLALLSAAYGRPVAPAVLGHLGRAAQCWREGEDALAAIHLALTGLDALDEPREGACRLFVADALMKAGASPRTILEALDLAPPCIETVEKFYDPKQARVPQGNGIFSGRWTRVASFLGDITPEAAVALGRFALLGGAAATFGLLFIPSPNRIRVEGDVPGLPRGRYVWNRDETEVRLTYDGPEGAQRTVFGHLQEELVRDERGRVIGRVLPGDTVAIDAAAVDPDLARKDEPRLCPAEQPDKASGKKGWAYQAYMAEIINPRPVYRPTPLGFGYELVRPNGEPVSFDDCQQSTGMMAEDKGPGYAKLLKKKWGMISLTKQWLAQSARQLETLRGRELTWYFAEPEAAAFAAKLFDAANQGRKRIHIEVRQWKKETP